MTHILLCMPSCYLLSDSEELFVNIRNANMFLIPSFNFCVHTLVDWGPIVKQKFWLEKRLKKWLEMPF